MEINTDELNLMELTAADVVIRPAIPDEAMILSDITWRSIGYWGYDEEFLRSSGEFLNIKRSFIEKESVYVAERQEQIYGFYGLSDETGEPHLAYLQIAPEYMGQGLGKLLWHHAIRQARARGWKSLKIHADRYSEPFFTHMGAVKIHEHNYHALADQPISVLRYQL